MNVRVMLSPPSKRRMPVWLNSFRWLLLPAGVVAIGYAGYVYIDSAVYQVQEERAFDARVLESSARRSKPARVNVGTASKAADRLDSATIGRIAIPRLHLKAIVAEGVDLKTLRRAVGHVPGTALPGEAGNVGLAGHRDSFFRELRDIRKDDRITVETVNQNYEYVVESMKIVGPRDVQVLAQTPSQSLTLVTCYPFQYTGNAPRRFVVRARQVLKPSRDVQGF